MSKAGKQEPADIGWLKTILERFYCRQLLFMVYAAFFYLLSACKKDPGPVWLIGENSGECLQDNGYCFFKFCRQQFPQAAVYFVLQRDSINIDSFLANDPNILWYGTAAHARRFIQARVCLFATAHRDIAWKTIFALFKKNSLNVFLQHGIMGFKKTDCWYNATRNPMDLFCVSSALEKNIIIQNFDFDPQVVQVTGLGRYDSLRNRADSRKPVILYMPTWRDWQVKHPGLFADQITSLLANSRLLSLLRETGTILQFYPHKNMRRIFTDSRFRTFPACIQPIRPGQETVHNLLVRANLLITDYSSVSWDFFYLHKPVLFYQFDQQEYLLKTGGYLNLNRDCFGPVLLTEEQLIAAIEQYISTSFKEAAGLQPMRKKYFAFHDRNNCQRIYDAVIRLTHNPVNQTESSHDQ